MLVQLILAQGSRAGVKAGIQEGYYMIGRHAECQIRPKSRSVSRRHCLIHHQPDGVRVLDLGSKSGTTVNGNRLVTLQWIDVAHGDQLRCGKVAFDISIQTTPVTVPADAEEPTVMATSTESASGGSVVNGEAWQEFDIAAFLENQDDLDRAKRYEDIRQKTLSDSDDSEFDSVDAEALFRHEVADAKNEGASNEHSTVDSETKHAERATLKPAPSPKVASNKKKLRASRFGASLAGQGDQLKMAAVILFTLGVFGYLVYSVVQFQSGPDIRVIEGID